MDWYPLLAAPHLLRPSHLGPAPVADDVLRHRELEGAAEPQKATVTPAPMSWSYTARSPHATRGERARAHNS